MASAALPIFQAPEGAEYKFEVRMGDGSEATLYAAAVWYEEALEAIKSAGWERAIVSSLSWDGEEWLMDEVMTFEQGRMQVAA